MLNKSAIGLYGLLAAAIMLVPSSARAQFTPRALNDPPTGERYHIEGAIGLWKPAASMVISSESLGIPGDQIDVKKDLGLTDQTFKEFQAVLRPAKKHKFRFQYIPIEYDQTATVNRDITFNGQLYHVGVPVESHLKWNAYRFTYEYDIVSRNRGFGGLLLEAKYTDVGAILDSPTSANPSIHEFAEAKAPIPAIGAIVRFYVVPNISITGELSGIDIPKIQDKYKAHYADIDIYGTVNIIENVGVQLGFRTFDVGYLINHDTGDFTLKGLYFGVVARY